MTVRTIFRKHLRLLLWALFLVGVAAACTPEPNTGTPRPGNVAYVQEFRLPDDVRCYVYGSVGISCLVVPE